MNKTPGLHRHLSLSLGWRRLPLLLVALGLCLPLLALLAAWWPGAAGGQALAILRGMAATVLPGYAGTTLWLCAGVAVGVALVGTATAAVVTLFDFPGRRVAE